MSELRVPPAVTMKFENTAHYVCNKAKLDFDEWPLHIHEFVTHLQDRWREGIDLGLDTDQAEERALQLFGNLNKVAHALRKPWLKRLMYDERCRVLRYIIIVLSVANISFDTMPIFHPANREILFGSVEYYEGFLVHYYGFIVIASLSIIRWKPNCEHVVLRRIVSARYIFSIFVLICIFYISVFYYGLLLAMGKWMLYGTKCYDVYLFVFAAAIIGALADACLISELFNLPGRAKRKQGRCSRVIAV
jgi:hypothetical protein